MFVVVKVHMEVVFVFYFVVKVNKKGLVLGVRRFLEGFLFMVGKGKKVE